MTVPIVSALSRTDYEKLAANLAAHSRAPYDPAERYAAGDYPNQHPGGAMPAVPLGFMLKPDGFFDRSPALDVPPSPHAGDGPHCH